MFRAVTLAILMFFLALLSAPAQSPNATPPAPAAQSTDSTKPADETKPKKVWTNENISGASGVVSVVGDAQGSAKARSNPEKPADAQYISTARKQLEKLQSQIDDTRKQIADLKNFSRGAPSSSSSGIELDHRYAREPIEVQIRSLEDKKKDLQAKIDALLDEARKKGIEPGQLR
jgi:TolA-binding protein